MFSPSDTAHRWAGFGMNIFSEMSALAQQYDAVNLAQGFPDFRGPEQLIESMARLLRTLPNQYAPMTGEPILKERLAQWIEQTTGLRYHPSDEITITTGATEALWTAVMAFINPGDRVIVFEPFFDTYAQAIAGAGGTLVPVRLHAPDTPIGNGNWRCDWQEFDTAITSGAKMIIVNSPHNPTGKVFSATELEHIAAQARRVNAIVLTDEVYENLIFIGDTTVPGELFQSRGCKHIRISSMAKTFGFTGFKCGWVCTNPAMSKAFRLVHQAVVFCVPSHIQLGLAEILMESAWLNAYLQAQIETYRIRQQILRAGLEAAGFHTSPTQGSYFIMASYEKLTCKQNDVDFAKSLIQEKRVAAIPPSAFYQTAPERLPWLRFAFCKKEETLELAVRLLTANASKITVPSL